VKFPQFIDAYDFRVGEWINFWLHIQLYENLSPQATEGLNALFTFLSLDRDILISFR
jgi:hypothetical protein